MQAWLDELREGILLFEGGRVGYMNRRAGELLGVDPAQAPGMPLIGVLRDHRLEHAALARQHIEVVRHGRVIEARPIDSGLALVDVSAERRAREGARSLLAVLSHELRTPLTTVRAALEALQFDPPEAQRQKLLARAEAESERLVRLLDDLTVESAAPRERRLLLSEVMERAAAVLQPLLAERGITLEAELGEAVVWADADKLLQVLLNLIENAARHGPERAVVRVAVEQDADDPDFLAVRVQDFGEPLDEAAFEPLFEPHARGVRAEHRGSGLGLYIVRAIVARWRGRSWGRPLESGNEFGFTVPRPPPPGRP